MSRKNKLTDDVENRLDIPHPYYGDRYRATEPKRNNKGAPRGAHPEKWMFPHDAYKTGEHSRYIQQRTQARFRGDAWAIEFEDWLKAWEDSGKQQCRGNQKGCWSMTRIDRTEPWSKHNIEIITVEALAKRNGSCSRGKHSKAD